MNLASLELERAQPGDRYADYCLWDYQPIAPTRGKLRSACLLWKAIDCAGGGPRLAAACMALREALGPFQTVYGVKKIGSKLSFEFYFYDYARLERRVSISRVIEILRPFTRCVPRPQEGRAYFMFSIDLDEEIASGQKPIETLNVYIGNPGSSVSSGICYEQTAAGLRLANFYFFFNAKREMDDIVAKLCCSAHFDLKGFRPAAVLRPDMLNCEVVVVANKKFNDGVYFSRLPVDPLIGFLAREGFPHPLLAFAQAHRDELDHLLYDVGVDYVVQDGQVKVVKSAFYGLL